MYIPKRYGQSKIDACPFCGQRATGINSQGVPVCRDHTSALLNDMKCICGSWLEMKTGKFGVYFNCMSCGNFNLKKVQEFNEVKDVSKKVDNMKSVPKAVDKKNAKPKNPREITIRSDDPYYFS